MLDMINRVKTQRIIHYVGHDQQCKNTELFIMLDMTNRVKILKIIHYVGHYQ